MQKNQTSGAMDSPYWQCTKKHARLKIVYILRSMARMAGVERVVSDKMNYLVKHGFEVSLITYEQGKHPIAFPLNKAIDHRDFDTRFFTLHQQSIIKRLVGKLRMRKRFKQLLQSFVDDYQPDIIITTTYSIEVTDLILSVNTSAKRIVESHVTISDIRKVDNFSKSLPFYIFATLYDKWRFKELSKCDCLVALTFGDANDWQQYIPNLRVIPNPVTLYPEEINRRDGTGRKIISVGRLEYQKGYDMLLNAFDIFVRRCPGWHLDIYGDGSDRAALTERIARLGLGNSISLNPTTTDIYKEYQSSEFYVMSSRYEGYALVLLEAMACGLPCVSFKCKYGPEDIIADGKSGLLASDGDINDLAEKMYQMATHTHERLQMGIEARKAVKRNTLEKIMKQWVDLFEKLTGAQNGAPEPHPVSK